MLSTVSPSSLSAPARRSEIAAILAAGIVRMKSRLAILDSEIANDPHKSPPACLEASAIYNCEFGELRVNAKTAREKELYCRLLGKHIFGNENLFPTGVKYTLDPLREFEFDALAPGGVEGVRDVRMIELWLGDPDDRYGVTTIRKGSDLLDWAQAKKKNIRIKRRLISATFKMELEGRKSDLAITVRPPNVAIYSRGPVSSTIEDWLSQRGFIISKQPPRKPRHEPALASN